jgi:sister-chromatid-cohesion protein PDS5
MAPRRAAAASAPVEEEEEASHLGLSFNEPLSWRAGKAIPTNTLLQRLDVLAKELHDREQGDFDQAAFTKIAKELTGAQLLQHKDKGVRAYTACCVVDILRICAPDAPFMPSQLRVRRLWNYCLCDNR